MKYVLALLVLITSVSALAADNGGLGTRRDPILGDSVTAITDRKPPKGVQRIDPVLGDSVTAIAKPHIDTVPEVKYNHGFHGYRPASPHLPKWYVHHGYGINPVVIVESPIYQTQGNSSVSGITPTDTYIIDGNPLIFTTVWKGTCYNSDCTVSAGYLAADPSKGVLVVTNPYINEKPVLVYAPNASGPLVLTKEDKYNQLLTLQSQAGEYPVYNPSAALGSKPVIMKTPGGENFVYNINAGRWQ